MMKNSRGNETASRLKLFIPATAVIAADQISKALVVRHIRRFSDEINIIGDFFTLIHVRNKAAGFSLGSELTGFMRLLMIFIVPMLLMAGLSWALYNWKKYKIQSKIYKFSISLVIGGGIGNLIDRIFRPKGVVDFLNVKVYGFLGFEYWPTFNVADSAVVIGVFAIIISEIAGEIRSRKVKSESES